MCHIFFIHSSVDGHLGCFHALAIVNRAAMNMVVHDSFWIMVFSGYMPRSGIVGSLLTPLCAVPYGRGDTFNPSSHLLPSVCDFTGSGLLLPQGQCCLPPCSRVTCELRMVYTFLNGWKKIKMRRYFMTHENDMKSKFLGPWIKVLLEHGFVVGCLCTGVAELGRCNRGSWPGKPKVFTGKVSWSLD